MAEAHDEDVDMCNVEDGDEIEDVEADAEDVEMFDVEDADEFEEDGVEEAGERVAIEAKMDPASRERREPMAESAWVRRLFNKVDDDDDEDDTSGTGPWRANSNAVWSV